MKYPVCHPYGKYPKYCEQAYWDKDHWAIRIFHDITDNICNSNLRTLKEFVADLPDDCEVEFYVDDGGYGCNSVGVIMRENILPNEKELNNILEYKQALKDYAIAVSQTQIQNLIKGLSKEEREKLLP